MTKKLELYKCQVCGNLVEVVKNGEGTLVCCGQDMVNLTNENHTGDSEMHKPIIESDGDKKTIRIGQIPHAMTDEHYVEFIEVISEDGRYVKRKYLYPAEVARLDFDCTCKSKIKARELCNIHGLWEN